MFHMQAGIPRVLWIGIINHYNFHGHKQYNNIRQQILEKVKRRLKVDHEIGKQMVFNVAYRVFPAVLIYGFISSFI